MGHVPLTRGNRALGSAIYYLLEAGTFSEMHMLASDEMFHFYLGDPVEMLQLCRGRGLRRFYSWTGFAGGAACAAPGSGGRVAGHAAGGGREGGAAGLHGDAGLRFRRLPRRELCGAGGEMAGAGGADAEVDAKIAVFAALRGSSRRRSRKKLRSSSADSSAAIPCSTCIWWLSWGWLSTESTEPQAPALGSAAAKTRRSSGRGSWLRRTWRRVRA